MFTLNTCLSGGAGLAPPVVLLPPPQATATNNPALASEIARMRNPRCIRVLPLYLILPPSSRGRPGRECADSRSYSHSLYGQSEFCCGGVTGVKFIAARRSERPFDFHQCEAIEMVPGDSAPGHSSTGEVTTPDT